MPIAEGAVTDLFDRPLFFSLYDWFIEVFTLPKTLVSLISCHEFISLSALVCWLYGFGLLGLEVSCIWQDMEIDGRMEVQLNVHFLVLD